jgi:hypothetical protein
MNENGLLVLGWKMGGEKRWELLEEWLRAGEGVERSCTAMRGEVAVGQG